MTVNEAGASRYAGRRGASHFAYPTAPFARQTAGGGNTHEEQLRRAVGHIPHDHP